jgi:hypothetical protein
VKLTVYRGIVQNMKAFENIPCGEELPDHGYSWFASTLSCFDKEKKVK